VVSSRKYITYVVVPSIINELWQKLRKKLKKN